MRERILQSRFSISVKTVESKESLRHIEVDVGTINKSIDPTVIMSSSTQYDRPRRQLKGEGSRLASHHYPSQ